MAERPRFVLALALFGCAPGNVGEPASDASSVAAKVASPADVVAGVGTGEERAPSELERAPSPEPQPPAPEVADSTIRTGFTVDPGAQAGVVAFAAAYPQAGTLWVGQLEGNGGRDVLIFIPPGADDAQPFELVFHFHGTYSEHVEQQREGLKKNEWVGWERLEQTLAAITELQQTRIHNVALIYPFSAGKRLEPGHSGWSNVAYDRMWMDPAAPPDYRDDFAELHEQAVALLVGELGVHPSKLPDAVIAEGHSAGGIALLNIARRGSANVREFIFLDASFQSWADGCFTAVKESGAKAKLTLVVTDKGIADPFTGRDPWCVDMKADASLWTSKKSWCASRASERVAGRGAGEGVARPATQEQVPGSSWTCEELELRAQEWRDDYQSWCAAYEDGMQSLDQVTLIPTKVYHKDQPRRFSGGLELPEDRLR